MKSQSIKSIRANNTRTIKKYPEAVRTLIDLGIISENDNSDKITETIKEIKSHQYGIIVQEGSSWVPYNSFVEYSNSIHDYQLREKFESLVFDMMEEDCTIKPYSFITFNDESYGVSRADARDIFNLKTFLISIPKD